MTIYKSRQVNLDPKPYDGNTATPEHPDDNRFDAETGAELIHNGMALEWAPRPEFEPTRDPEPWIECGDIGHRRYAHPEQEASIDMRWSPRRYLYDTPVNPILVEFRNAVRPGYHAGAAETWWAYWEQFAPNVYTPDQIDHARRVLERLVRLAEGGTK